MYLSTVAAAVYTEALFKGASNKGESFLDQQFWLYLYGIFVATIVHSISQGSYGLASFVADLQGIV